MAAEDISMAFGPTFTTTTHAVMIPEVWASEVQKFLKARLGLENRVNRSSQKDAKFGDTIHIPKVSEFDTDDAGMTKSAYVDENTPNEVTFQAPTEGEVVINLNKHKYIAFKIEDLTKIQSRYDLRSKYTEAASYGMKKRINIDLATLMSGFSNVVGALGVKVADTDRLRAHQYLLDANVDIEDPDNITWLLSPAEFTSWVGEDKIQNANYFGDNAALKKAQCKVVYNGVTMPMTILPGDNSAGHQGGYFHQDAIALVMQKTPGFHAIYWPRGLSWEVVTDMVYGVKELRDVMGVFLRQK
jgi:hypothetical protein